MGRRDRRVLGSVVARAAARHLGASAPCRFEPLEGRRLFCADPAAHAAGLPTAVSAEVRSLVDDSPGLTDDLRSQIGQAAAGRAHIPLSVYNTLSRDLQSLINPHFVEDDRPESEQLAALGTPPSGISEDAFADALPDFVPLVGGTGGYLQPYIDTTEQPGRNLLRFSTAVGNMGDGPAILTSSNTAVNADGTQNVTQVIYAVNDAGQFVQNRTRTAGRFVWHNGHSHFHYEGYATYRLLQNVGGSPGAVVTRADGTTAVGDKVGFCLININTSFTMPGVGTSSSTLTNYNRVGQPSTSCGMLQGIHVGRADVYDSVYDGQWIDVTGVPNGNYFLEVTLDGSNAVLEKNETNNTVYVAYTLNATNPTGGVATDRFESPSPNNSFAAATNLGELGVQTQAGLTIHANYDEDFFRFTAASTGSGTIITRATHGDVNLSLYDSGFNLLRASSSATEGSTTTPAVETVTYSFVRGQTYYARVEGFASGTNPATGLSRSYSLEANIKPTVDVAFTQSRAKENKPGQIQLNVTRNGPYSAALTVTLAFSGTATAGLDYQALSTTAVIDVTNYTKSIPLTILNDILVEPDETLIVTVTTNSNYVLGNSSATLMIVSDDVAPTTNPNGTRTPVFVPATPPAPIAGRPGSNLPGASLPGAILPGAVPPTPESPSLLPLLISARPGLFSDEEIGAASL